MQKAFFFFFGWFLIINLFALVGNNRLNLATDTAYNWIDPSYTFQVKSWNPLALHNRWDSYWYLDIARNGYVFRGVGELSNIVFFPLYPLLISSVSSFFHLDYIFAGWVISNLSLVGTIYYLYLLVEQFHKESDPLLTVILLLVFPTAFFLNAVYIESLFLFLSIASYYYLLRKNYAWAGVFGFFASLTHLTGVLLFIPFMIEYVKEEQQNLKSLGFVPLLLLPLGTASFFAYHYFKFDNVLLFFQVEKWWGRNFIFNLQHFSVSTNAAVANLALDIFLTIFALVSLVFVFRRLRLSYGVYMLTTILVALSSGTLMSIGRFILVLFPIYILGGTIKNKAVYLAWVMTSTLLLALYSLLFVAHYWAG